MSQRSHMAWLDGVRAVAALWVVAHHAYLTVGFAPRGFLERCAADVLASGYYAVTLFIAISGFSLAYGASRAQWTLPNGYREFMVARAIRIVPPYYAGLALSALLATTLLGRKTGTLWDLSIPITPGSFAKHLLLVQHISGTPKVNYAYWSISVEFHIYVFFGLVLFGLRRHGPLGAVVVGGLLGAVAALVCAALSGVGSGWFTGNREIVPFFSVFAFGVAACWLSKERPSVGARYGSLLAVLAGLFVLYKVWAYGHNVAVPISLLDQAEFGLACAAILYAFATHEGTSRVSSVRPLPIMGSFAYSLYLVHAPVVQAIFVLWGGLRRYEGFGTSILFGLVSVLASTAIAYGFYLAFERPCFALRHALKARTLRRGKET